MILELITLNLTSTNYKDDFELCTMYMQCSHARSFPWHFKSVWCHLKINKSADHEVGMFSVFCPSSWPAIGIANYLNLQKKMWMFIFHRNRHNLLLMQFRKNYINHFFGYRHTKIDIYLCDRREKCLSSWDYYPSQKTKILLWGKVVQ